MTMTPQQLVERGSLMFNERQAITTLWQEIAENFYPQRADFTLTRYVGEEFANHLYSSYPLIVHRELSGAFASMLRPRRKPWFQISVADDDQLSKGSKAWLEWATKRQKKAMYDRKAQFIRATNEGDGDFAAFGQCCISREIMWNVEQPHLLYRCWHLRDVAWSEQADQSIGEIYVKWKPTIKQLEELPLKLHHTMQNKSGSQNLAKVECMRLVVSTDIYKGQEGAGDGFPWLLVYLDVLNNHIMAEHGMHSHGFTLPRWQTVSGSQYAYSPATVAGLPDARLLQAMSLTLLEAGEMSVRPAMIATQDALRSDVQLYAGGITYADVEYDARKGDVLRPITQDRRGLPNGFEVRDSQQQMLSDAFFLNKLSLPPAEQERTAFEVGEMIEEYIRAALPLFEPMEIEYNGQMCEDTFDSLMMAGHFGPIQDIPQELQSQDVEFKFVSPLHDAIERKDASVFLESSQLIEAAMAMDETSVVAYDVVGALQDALAGVGNSVNRIRSDDEVKAMVEQAQEMRAQQEAAELAKTAGAAAKDMSAAA